jgi:hypothetical protein
MPPPVAKVMGNINFGTAKGLTETAKEAQSAVQGAIKGTFVVRGNWWQQSNRYGIRIKPATKADLRAEIRTMADWLEPHETGKDKQARGGQVAVPTENVRRNKRLIIPRGQRPKGLGSKAFVLQTKHGPVLAQRISRGPRKGLVVLYGLERSVRIRKQSTFYEPIQKVVRRRLEHNVKRGIAHAFATAR